ncbi:unnamed protein product [Phytomonas sp. Hart1]|nr:unnamed protein product [Phytomonas sp. Hart1]|eukprot:CCW72006.1 unnamed protein product [Phytomonas sp. isolate Hart1]
MDDYIAPTATPRDAVEGAKEPWPYADFIQPPSSQRIMSYTKFKKLLQIRNKREKRMAAASAAGKTQVANNPANPPVKVEHTTTKEKRKHGMPMRDSLEVPSNPPSVSGRHAEKEILSPPPPKSLEDNNGEEGAEVRHFRAREPQSPAEPLREEKAAVGEEVRGESNKSTPAMETKNELALPPGEGKSTPNLSKPSTTTVNDSQAAAGLSEPRVGRHFAPKLSRRKRREVMPASPVEPLNEDASAAEVGVIPLMGKGELYAAVKAHAAGKTKVGDIKPIENNMSAFVEENDKYEAEDALVRKFTQDLETTIPGLNTNGQSLSFSSAESGIVEAQSDDKAIQPNPAVKTDREGSTINSSERKRRAALRRKREQRTRERIKATILRLQQRIQELSQREPACISPQDSPEINTLEEETAPAHFECDASEAEEELCENEVDVPADEEVIEEAELDADSEPNLEDTSAGEEEIANDHLDDDVEEIPDKLDASELPEDPHTPSMADSTASQDDPAVATAEAAPEPLPNDAGPTSELAEEINDPSEGPPEEAPGAEPIEPPAPPQLIARKRLTRHRALANARRQRRLNAAVRKTDEPRPEPEVAAPADLSGSPESRLNPPTLTFPDGRVVLENFTDGEMIVRRDSTEQPWGIGLRYDWSARALAVASFPTFPANDPRLQHGFIQRYHNRPVWYLKEVNGTSATNLKSVMEVLSRTLTARFVFKRL